ncbi:hypothetical protein [uncultured Eudoraea sp.]|uniref:hypothetical protein n=1 Tax=uncultured Eudoraea sp. TaxID=1035614 RepID=UPI00261E20F6|nr:hypothetical protein [uncultured Eudoraea sp.]
MKNAPYLLMLFALVLSTGCSSDDNIEPVGVNEVIVDQVEYNLVSQNGSGITGKATFTRDSNDNTTILIELTNTNTEEHPASVNYNTASEGGPKAITLEPCTCAVSTTVVTKLDDGTPIDFDKLVNFDGHVSIQDTPANPEVVASVDIGANAN